MQRALSTSNFNPYLKWIVTVLVFAIAFWSIDHFIYTYVIKIYDREFRLKEFLTQGNQCPIIGTSHVNHGIDTLALSEMTRCHSVSTWFPSAKIQLRLNLIQEIFRHSSNRPRLIILEMDKYAFSNRYDSNAFSNIEPYLHLGILTDYIRLQNQIPINYFFSVISASYTIRGKLLVIQSDLFFDELNLISYNVENFLHRVLYHLKWDKVKGKLFSIALAHPFNSVPSLPVKAAAPALKSSRSEGWPNNILTYKGDVDSEPLSRFKEIIEFLHGKNVPLLIIETPNFGAGRFKREESEFSKVREIFAKSALKNSNVFYFRPFNILEEANEDLFDDPTHLSLEGKKIFTDKLGNWINTHGFGQSHSI